MTFFFLKKGSVFPWGQQWGYLNPPQTGKRLRGEMGPKDSVVGRRVKLEYRVGIKVGKRS